MSRTIKKTLALTAGLFAGLFFALTVCIDAMLIIDLMNGDISLGTACLIIAFSVPVMCTCMFFLIYFNRVFDEGEGLVQKNLFMGRWPMNSLFISLVMTVLFAMIYVQESSQRGLLFSERRYSPAVFLIAVFTAVFLYMRNYHRFRPRNRQIRAAEKTYALNQKRKFTFVIEKYLDDGGLYGTVQGEMHAGDSVYVINGETEDFKNRIRISSILKDGRKTRSVSEGKAKITVQIPAKAQAQPAWFDFTVLSNVRPGHTIYRRIAAENPRIRAMLSTFGEYTDNSRFMSALIYDLVHGHYLTAAKTDEENARSGDITESMNGSHSVMFQAVSSSRNPDQSVFPVFTDWEALSRYENVMEDEKSVILLMDFQQASEMLQKGYEGIVINPFGPASYYLSREYISSIKSLEGYRREFILKEDAE